MRILKSGSHIDFLGKRTTALVFSLLVMAASLGSLAVQGLNLGIDFTGGTLIEVGYPDAADLSSVRSGLSESGFGDAKAQHFGTAKDVLIRLAPREGIDSSQLSNQVFDSLQGSSDAKIDLRRVEFVGPQVGEELTEDGGLAMLYALAGILVYVSLRFQFKFSLGAIAALVHDVIITLGIFSVFQLNFDLPVLAAILAVIGYSLNDSIVVFDRIRENFRIVRKGDSVHVINISINQMLARTIVTSLTTLLVLVSLAVIGGEIIHGFAIALIIGVVVGTYSSIYIASTVTILLGINREDLAPVAKEGEDGVGPDGDQV